MEALSAYPTNFRRLPTPDNASYKKNRFTSRDTAYIIKTLLRLKLVTLFRYVESHRAGEICYVLELQREDTRPRLFVRGRFKSPIAADRWIFL